MESELVVSFTECPPPPIFPIPSLFLFLFLCRLFIPFPLLLLTPRTTSYYTYVFQEEDIIQLLKQKDFHNVLIDIPDPDIYLPKFFQVCHDVGLYGEGRNFFLSTLEFNELTTPNPPNVFNKHYNKVYPHWKSFSFFRIHNRDLAGSLDFADAMSAMHLLQRQRLLRSRNHDERGQDVSWPSIY